MLDNVRYDQRMCEAHIFSADIRDDLAKAFRDSSTVELMVDDIDDKIQYISWQNRKLRYMSHLAATVPLLHWSSTAKPESWGHFVIPSIEP